MARQVVATERVTVPRVVVPTSGKTSAKKTVRSRGRTASQLAAEVRASSRSVSDTAVVLLQELREECENVVELVRRLEAGPRSARERDELLGEISAAVLHLHTHTDGLDEFLCETT